jgi:hypothetical protein
VRDEASTSSFPWGNTTIYAYSTKSTDYTHALDSISTIRSPEWIVDSSASRYIISNAREFSSYTRLTMPGSIQTADGTTQPVVGKDTVNYGSVTLSNVLIGSEGYDKHGLSTNQCRPHDIFSTT